MVSYEVGKVAAVQIWPLVDRCPTALSHLGEIDEVVLY